MKGAIPTFSRLIHLVAVDQSVNQEPMAIGIDGRHPVMVALEMQGGGGDDAVQNLMRRQ